MLQQKLWSLIKILRCKFIPLNFTKRYANKKMKTYVWNKLENILPVRTFFSHKPYFQHEYREKLISDLSKTVINK